MIEDKPKKAIKRIVDFEIDNAEEVKNNPDIKTVKFKIDGAANNLKVHMFASNTLFGNHNHMILPYAYLCNYSRGSTFKFQKFENDYLNNKKLGDELRYALERKYLKSFIGTTLERPSLLYNKKFYCDTYFETESRQQEQNYQKFSQIAPKSLPHYGSLKVGGKKGMNKKMMMKSVGGGGVVYYYSDIEKY